MESNQLNKAQRLLKLFVEFTKHNELTRDQVKEITGIDSDRTAQRYIKDLKELLTQEEITLLTDEDNYLFHIEEEENNEENSEDMESSEQNIRLLSNKEKLTYSLVNHETLNRKYVLVLLKLLLDSRALNKNEMLKVTNHLLEHLCIQDRQKVYQSIDSEVLRYKELTMATDLIETIWTLNEHIWNKEVLSFKYSNLSNVEKVIKMRPFYITQDEFYFYLRGYNGEKKRWTTLRIDRINEYEVITKDVISAEYRPELLEQTNELGHYKNSTPLMFNGNNEKITFEYYGNSPEAILDKFPDHEEPIYLKEGMKMTINAKVTDGLYMWLLSQGADIKVLTPNNVQEGLKLKLEKAMEMYE